MKNLNKTAEIIKLKVLQSCIPALRKADVKNAPLSLNQNHITHAAIDKTKLQL